MPRLRTLRADIPADVWSRLEAEAAEHGMKIGAYLRTLIVRRDARLHKFPETDIRPSDIDNKKGK